MLVPWASYGEALSAYKTSLTTSFMLHALVKVNCIIPDAHKTDVLHSPMADICPEGCYMSEGWLEKSNGFFDTVIFLPRRCNVVDNL